MDKIVSSVIEQIKQRSEAGFNKYGTNMERTDLSLIDWLQHAQEEAMDLAIYLERIKQDLIASKKLEESFKKIIKKEELGDPNEMIFFSPY